jgi:hypothetical protein
MLRGYMLSRHMLRGHVLGHMGWHMSIRGIAVIRHSWVPKWPIKRVIHKFRVHSGHLRHRHAIIPIVDTIWLIKCPRADWIGAWRLRKRIRTLWALVVTNVIDKHVWLVNLLVLWRFHLALETRRLLGALD